MNKFFISLSLFLSIFISAAESYNFFMISDTHFGRAESFPKKWTGKKKFRIPPSPHRADKAMPVYEALFKDISSKADAGTKFLIQCGDFAEGAAKDAAAYKEELNYALTFFNSHIKIPVYHVRGNHDNYGLGGNEAFDSVLLPVIAKSAGLEKMKYANYSFSCGKDLFIVLDYSGRAKWPNFLKARLARIKIPPRYLFVVIHTPFISNWKPMFTETFCDLLLPYNTILLSGHIHGNTITKYTKNGRSLVQVTATTCLPGQPVGTSVCTKHRQTLEEFKANILNKEKRQTHKAVIKNWIKNISEFTRVRGVGYARFHVTDDGIKVAFQGSDLASKPYTVEILKRKK